MPLVEKQVGKFLERLIERSVSEMTQSLDWREVDDEEGHWLLQTVFWLLSAKILRDKHVASFEGIDLCDVENVFHRVAKHYGTKAPLIGQRRKLEALRGAAETIRQSSSLVLTTTEALGYVYENALISKKTRSELETHSTPPFLVDYVVGNLADWIEEVPAHARTVYEPACGHAAFLVSAMRLLTELLPASERTPAKRGPYLRDRLHGTDIDPFALELARLSLTLTDIPNPDGWDLRSEDMFLRGRLGEHAGRSTILLANPPFDNFTSEERASYRERKSRVHFINKAAEMLWQTLTKLPNGGLFGVVLPQTFLHSENAREVRELLLERYELKEICLFPDGVFSFSDSESAIIIGRRKSGGSSAQIRYRRVRERDLPSFRSEYSTSTTADIPQPDFLERESASLRVPDLQEVWNFLKHNATLSDFAALGKGLEYRGRDLPAGNVTYSQRPRAGAKAGFVLFDPGIQLHQTPTEYWMNLAPSVIRRPVSGTQVGTPQVLLNYAPASRGPWRLKALIDREGHPVTSRFIPVRPLREPNSLEVLWAVLNSPVANAYAFSHLGKRDNKVGDIRRIPFPAGSSFAGAEHAARAYLEAAWAGAAADTLQRLMLQVDREVLRLYSLPVELEGALLDLFRGYRRVGVPFSQAEYLPRELVNRVALDEFLAFENDWEGTNRERGRLIEKSLSRALQPQERSRLEVLEAYADYHIEKVAPRPTDLLDELEKDLAGRRTER